jgi:hypothetical protein
MTISPQEVERMFNRLARLLSRIRPRKKTFTEDDLSKQEARLEAQQEREDRESKIGSGF